MIFKELFQKASKLFEQGAFAEALPVYLEALQKVNTDDVKDDVIECHLKLIDIFFRQNLLTKCDFHIEKAISLSKDIGNEVLYARAVSNKGAIGKNRGDYQQALKFLLEASEIFEREDECREYLSNNYDSIGGVYRHLEDFKNAAKYLTKALKIRVVLEYMLGVARSNNNLASVYFELNKFGKAEKCIQKAIDIKSGLDMEEPIVKLANSYSILANILMKRKKPKSAYEYYQRSLNRRLEHQDVKGLMGSYLELGVFYRKQKNFNKSIETLKKGLKLSKSTSFYSNVVACLLEMFNTYKKQKKHKKALQYHLKYEKCRRKLFTEKLWEFVSVKQIEFDVLQKDKKIENMEINIREFHHRIKNNFQSITSMLNNHYNLMKDDRLKTLIRETEARIQAMMSVHRYLFNRTDNSHINMKEYMENLIENLMVSYWYSEEDIDLVMEITDKKIDAQKAMHLGLIVNELVSNSFKYAFVNNDNPKLEVILELRENGSIYLKVADNGPGFNPKKKREDAFGLNLIEMLTEQLKGKGKFTSKNGTQFELVVDYYLEEGGEM